MSDCLMIVVSYENPTYTIEALESLRAQTHATDVVLWDNNSSPTTRDILADYKADDGVIKVFHNANLLWTPAINKAVQIYGDRYEYIGYMNNDITIPPNAIVDMITEAHKAETGAVGPKGHGIGGTNDYIIHLQRYLEKYPDKSEIDYQNQGPIRVPYILGACVLMRKSVWDTVGELDPEMPLGADDFDYAIRLADAGYHIYVLPHVVASHRSHATGDSGHWEESGGRSWHRFNTKYDGYYLTEEEATKCLWGSEYHPNWTIGTGWLSEEQRKPIWDRRHVG